MDYAGKIAKGRGCKEPGLRGRVFEVLKGERVSQDGL